MEFLTHEEQDKEEIMERKTIVLGSEDEEFAGYLCLYDVCILNMLDPKGNRDLLEACVIADVELYGSKYCDFEMEPIYEELSEIMGMPRERLFLYHE